MHQLPPLRQIFGVVVGDLDGTAPRVGKLHLDRLVAPLSRLAGRRLEQPAEAVDGLPSL